MLKNADLIRGRGEHVDLASLTEENTYGKC